MPCDFKRYPSDWKTISLRIREREGWRCAWCKAPDSKHFGGVEILRAPQGYYMDPTRGDFDVMHGMGWVSDGGIAYEMDELCEALRCGTEYGPEGNLLPTTLLRNVKVVLTVAHIYNPDPMDCRDENLAALCQRCHNVLDAPMRAGNRAATRRKGMAAASLFPELEAAA